MIVKKFTDEQLEITRNMLTHVCIALDEKGYNALDQIQGYLLTEDPTYITTYNDARKAITALDREDLLRCILEVYLGLYGADGE